MLLTISGLGLYFPEQNVPFLEGISKGRIEDARLNEISGMAASYANSDMFWVHNDSGDRARLFLLDDSGRTRGEWFLAGVVAKDWEEMASFQQDGKAYLMIGDMGDNLGKREFIEFHVFREPVYAGPGFERDTLTRANIFSITARFEDGPKDAEAMFYDPQTKDLYVISKRELQVGLYKAQLEIGQADTLLLKRTMSLPLTFVTGADLSLDGNEILIKNLLSIYYWKRQKGESIEAALKRPYVKLPYQVEPQGEALAFGVKNEGYYTLSEAPLGLPIHLLYYPRYREKP